MATGQRPVLAALHVANGLVGRVGEGGGVGPQALDLDLLERAGAADDLSRWRAIAAQREAA